MTGTPPTGSTMLPGGSTAQTPLPTGAVAPVVHGDGRGVQVRGIRGPLRLEPFVATRMAVQHVADPAAARAFARPYHRVAERLAQWERRGHLLEDDGPALWVHEYGTPELTVRGLVGVIPLDLLSGSVDEAALVPHEGVEPDQVAELASRMRETHIQPAPILLAHRGTPRLRAILAMVTDQEPLVDGADRAGQIHRLWRVPEQFVTDVQGELAGTRALLADGHHRYAAYLDEARRGDSLATSGLAMLIDQDDTPLALGPIHRFVAGLSLSRLGQVAHAAGLPVTDHLGVRLTDVSPSTIVATDGRRTLTIRLGAAGEHDLPLQVVHQGLLPQLVDEYVDITHHHAAGPAIAQTRHEDGVALLLAPLTLERVLEITDRDGVLPEKSTSFQPKPNPSILLRRLHD
ncbi:DUF1015 family protein [Nocardioides bruguierae]|uniref:DUF1015 family protein n=1 Tax=Nocardioides bruguierae TaxID=2945102 RepID=UPI0020205900|nr:DUF1015 family protein [Nocardioides bruguierae]MCL8026077.1 DUF1015 domain-containing protein [Nocardioides bruguierae]